jgi:hypothetical protein
MEPHECDQEENIAKLFDYHEEKMKKLQEMEVRQVEIQGDIKHIKTRIDNGMSHTIQNLDQTLTKLVPVIDHHSNIVKRIEGIGWTLATSFILALVAYLAWGVSHGFKLPS